jgi:hypothetical protein
MSNNLEKIYNSAMYARKKGIDATNPDTWDDNYRARQMELAGILPKIEEEIKNIKEGIKKAGFNS